MSTFVQLKYLPQSDDIVRKDQQLRDLQRDNEKLKARLKLLELKNVEHEKKTKLRQPQPKTQATETDLKDCVDKDLNVQQDQLKQQQQQGCNSIDIFLGPETCPSHFWSFETYLNW